MNDLFLSMGSNIEPREFYLREAIKELNREFEFKRTSSLYNSEPLLYKKQDFFLNICVHYKTAIENPFDILKIINSIEKKLGRKRNILLKGPRTIDIDILLFEEFEINSVNLTIPHKGMLERKFVLEPLIEIMPLDSIYYYKYDLLNNLVKVNDQKLDNIGVLKIE